MSSAVSKLAELKDVMIEVDVSGASGIEDQFIGRANVSRFNPDKFVTNGGPVTVKAVSVKAMGKSYDEAYNNVLERAVSLLGL